MRKSKLDQGTDDWLKWRNAGLGASEVGCVMGANPHRGSQAKDIWSQKLPKDHPDYRPPKPSNPAMRRGQELEPEARRIYESLFGWRSDPLCCIHDTLDHVRCSLDGLSPDEQVNMECKCSGLPNHLKYVAISRIDDPFERQCAFASTFPSYRYQQLYQLIITDAKVSHFVAYNPDCSDPSDRFATFEFYREPAEEERLLQRTNEFWQFVLDRQAPPPEWCVATWRLPDPSDLRIP